jgi:membrane-associated phospholipid phosphatase
LSTEFLNVDAAVPASIPHPTAHSTPAPRPHVDVELGDNDVDPACVPRDDRGKKSSTLTGLALQSRCRGRAIFIVAAGLLVLAVAAFMLLDATLVRAVHDAGVDRWLRKNQTLPLIVRWPGHVFCALVVAAALLVLHPWRLGAVAITLVGVLFSGSNWILKWAVGRYRPVRRQGLASFEFHPFPDGFRGLFHERNLSMPSGDVSLAFALAAALSWLLPRWTAVLFVWPVLVAVERVAENAHHLSDVLAGAALGLVSFHLARVACTLLGVRQGDALPVSGR